MNNLPLAISLLFGLTTLLTIVRFYKAANRSKITLLVIVCWLVFQSFLAISGFYLTTDAVPPRFLFLLFPPLILILGLFASGSGRAFIDQVDLKTLTILHVIRVPVEIVLLLLFIHKTVPELMTFEGRNFDILSGLSAPIVYYFGFIRKIISRKIIIVWNILCLGLLINIVINAILSAPLPFQMFAFDQPNIAVLYFPFIWLPCCVVPIVLLAHMVAIRQLWIKSRK